MRGKAVMKRGGGDHAGHLAPEPFLRGEGGLIKGAAGAGPAGAADFGEIVILAGEPKNRHKVEIRTLGGELGGKFDGCQSFVNDKQGAGEQAGLLAGDDDAGGRGSQALKVIQCGLIRTPAGVSGAQFGQLGRGERGGEMGRAGLQTVFNLAGMPRQRGRGRGGRSRLAKPIKDGQLRRGLGGH